MALIDRELRDAWEALRANGRDRENALLEVRVKRLRNVEDLRVSFEYPVSVPAGPNASGKSTLLFACACAYQVPGAPGFLPGRLFPNFGGRQPDTIADAAQRSELEFHYLDQGERRSMVWGRSKSWRRRLVGGAGASQPAREVYLRTLANLTNPSAVPGILQRRGRPIRTDALSPELLVFAHRILPWRYRKLTLISDRARSSWTAFRRTPASSWTGTGSPATFIELPSTATSFKRRCTVSHGIGYPYCARTTSRRE